MSDWLVIIGMGVITHLLRLSMIITAGRLSIGAPLRHALRFAPAAVLSAIILPELLLPSGVLDATLANARLLAGVVAILVAWRTQNMIWTVLAGMITLWMLQALLPFPG